MPIYDIKAVWVFGNKVVIILADREKKVPDMRLEMTPREVMRFGISTK